VFVAKLARDRLQVAVGLRARDPGLETAGNEQCALPTIAAQRIEHQRKKDIGVSQDPGGALRREHADDRVSDAIEEHAHSQHTGIGRELALPEPEREQRDRCGAGTSVLRVE
jgi:hypothetical protein